MKPAPPVTTTRMAGEPTGLPRSCRVVSVFVRVLWVVKGLGPGGAERLLVAAANAHDADRFQLLAHFGPVWVPTQGLYLGLDYGLFDEDIAVADTERHAGTLWLSYQPTAHVEIMGSSRIQILGSSNVLTGLLQIHYYL